MRQLTLNFDGYAPTAGAAVSAGHEVAGRVRKSLDTLRENMQTGAAVAAGAAALLLMSAGFVLATGADTIPQALASLTCFALGAWPMGAYNFKKEGGEA